VLGHQVVVELRFDRLPSSPACRPVQISAAVFSGQPATSSYFALGGLATVQMVGRSGRFVVPLPFRDAA